jgi:hypothetical protein
MICMPLTFPLDSFIAGCGRSVLRRQREVAAPALAVALYYLLYFAASFHRIARPRPIFSTLPLRCMSLSWSVTRRTKSVRSGGRYQDRGLSLSRMASKMIYSDRTGGRFASAAARNLIDKETPCARWRSVR